MSNILNDKILTQNELLECIKSKHGKSKIVQCHGVFDLLHIGHINYLEESKSKGDLLIVTITSDRYVNKGLNKPFFSEILRAKSLAALQCTDYVLINNALTSVEVIKKIKPKFYVKGRDYNHNNAKNNKNLLLEKKAVESVGGKLIFTSGQVFSSSNLLNNFFGMHNTDQKSFLANLKKKFTYDQVKNQIDKSSNLKVLLIGEAIIDEYVFCDTIGKSGKEPIMISKKIKSKKYAGGILSVANHLSNLCKHIKILTCLGTRNDNYDFIKKSLQKNIILDYIRKNNSPTILKTRYLDNYTKSKISGIYDINDDDLNTKEEKNFLNKVSKNILKYDLVLVVDYGHGLITPKIVNLIEKKPIFIAVNTQLNSLNASFHSISKYKKVDYVCMHDGELRHDYKDRNESTEKLILKLKKRIKSKIVTITKGSYGSLSYNNNKFTYCPAFANKIVDRIGAGDTLLAITSIYFKCKIPDEITLLLGNIAAANTVSRMGTGENLNKLNLLNTIKYLMK